MRRCRPYLIAVLGVITAAVLVVRVNALNTDYYSINPAYPYVRSAAKGSKNINLRHALSSEMPTPIPLQKSPAATFMPNDVVVVWPKTAVNTAVGVKIINSRNQPVLSWAGVAHEQITTLDQLQHVAPGLYTIQAYQIDPVTQHPYNTAAVQGYRILGPVQYGINRFVVPVLFISAVSGLGMWFFAACGESKKAAEYQADQPQPTGTQGEKA